MSSRYRPQDLANEHDSIWPIFAFMVPIAFFGACTIVYVIDWLSSIRW